MYICPCVGKCLPIVCLILMAISIYWRSHNASESLLRSCAADAVAYDFVMNSIQFQLNTLYTHNHNTRKEGGYYFVDLVVTASLCIPELVPQFLRYAIRNVAHVLFFLRKCYFVVYIGPLLDITAIQLAQ